MHRLTRHLRNTLLAGALAAVPIVITLVAILWIERITREPLFDLTGINTPFLGLLIAIALVYLLGLAVSSLIGKWIISLIDRLLGRIPLLRELYAAWKHVSVTPDGTGMFSKVCLITDEAPRRILGFTSGQPLPADPATTCVFIPASPNPTSGQLFFVPITDVQILDMSVEDAFKLILSGGNYLPTTLKWLPQAPSALTTPTATPAPADRSS